MFYCFGVDGLKFFYKWRKINLDFGRICVKGEIENEEVIVNLQKRKREGLEQLVFSRELRERCGDVQWINYFSIIMFLN